jgi:glucose-1-phosphate cytidylyltransferase
MKYDGFWSCMDTYKDKQRFEDLVARGETPWEVWKHAESENIEAAAKSLAQARPR